MNEDIEKSLAEAVDKFQKQEEEKKSRFFVENDLNSSSLSRAPLNKTQNLSLLYKTNRFHVAVRLFSNRSQKTSKCGKNISDTLGYRLVCHFFDLTTF